MSVALTAGVLAAPSLATVYALAVPDPRRAARAVGLLLALAAAGATALLAVVALGSTVTGVLARPVLAGVPLTVGVRVDRFGALFLLLVAGIAAVVSGYARRYLDGEPGAASFQARVAGATTATLVMATAPSLGQLAVGWIAAGWALVGLIGYHRDQPRVRAAVRRTRRLFLLGDLALVAGLATLAVQVGDADLTAVRAAAPALPDGVLATAGLLLLLAGMVRSAQVPLHGWLPGTLDAPTPVSAFLHAGMVNVAGFLMITLAPVVVEAPAVMAATLLVGLVTAAVGTLFAAVRTDVKGALARSTVAQMGFMLAQCGLGAFGLAAVHLVGHGVFKAYAFLSAGGAVRAQLAAAHAPRPAGPSPTRRIGAAIVVLVGAVLLTELAVGGVGTGWLSAALVCAAGSSALAAALADRRLGSGTVVAVTAVVAGLAGGYLLLGAAAGRWLDLPPATTPFGVVVTVVVLAAVALLLRSARRQHAARLWWWAWREGYVALLPRRITTRRRGASASGWPTPGNVDRSDGARAIAAAATAGDLVAPAWPVETFVAVNPLAGLERQSFTEATARLRALGEVRTHLPPADYRRRLLDGDIGEVDLTAALAEAAPPPTPAVRLPGRIVEAKELFRLVLRHPVHDGPPPAGDLLAVARRRLAALSPADARPGAAPTVDPTGPETAEPTLAELLDTALGTRVGADVDDLVAGWCAAHGGRPAARWPVPGDETTGCWSRWLQVAAADAAPALLGVSGFARLVATLPAAPEQALAALLHALGVPVDHWAAYLSRSLLRLPGWAGYARWYAAHPGQGPALAVVDLLAVRLAYELALGGTVARDRLDVPGTLDAVRAALGPSPSGPAPDRSGDADASTLARLAATLGLDADTLAGLPDQDVAALRDALAALPPHRQSEIWLTAAEHAYRRRLRDPLDRHHEPETSGDPTVQAVFCIDVRSEGLRRHLEPTGEVQTLGFAGFFGLPVRTETTDARRGSDRCPVLMRPVATVIEGAAGTDAPAPAPSDGTTAPGDPVSAGDEPRAVTRQRARQGWRRAFAGAKGDPVGAFAFVEVAGVLAVGALLVRAALPGWLADRLDEPVPSRADLDRALTLDERVYYAEAMLRTIGLTGGFAPLLMLCGHGATSANNPYAAALDCGACGGNRGGVSARLAAGLLNDPAVRAGLAGRGIHLPAGTHVLAAEHDTVTDEVRLLDPGTVPATHRRALDLLSDRLAGATARLRAERAARLPDRPAATRIGRRAVDWAQVRPEWALAGNAAFIAAPRDRTRGLDLGCRTFLHSYDWSTDPDAAALETVMTGPLVVAAWINLQYYFSSVDPERFGAGSKTVHTVVGDGLGVLSGSGGDLRVGLPWQSVGAGERLVHEPLRLLAVVQAPPELLAVVLRRNPAVRDLVTGGWIHLRAVDPHTGDWWAPGTDGTWRPVPATAPGTGTPPPAPSVTPDAPIDRTDRERLSK